MVLWVDIDSGAVYEEAIRGGTVTVTRDLAFTTTVIAVAVADDGTLLDAGRDPLLHVARDGAVATIAHVIGPGSPLRLINGVCDPASRFLIGSQALDERTGEEGLYRLERDLSITVVDADLTFSNGLGWSETGGFSTPSRVRVRPDPPGHE